MAAIELTRRAVGSTGAVGALADWPLGQFWIGAVAVGLLCFAFWRALQAVFDADHQGHSPKALVGRAGQALSGLVYGTLAFSLFEVLDELEDIGEADENQTARQTAAEALSLPFGQWLVMLVGGFIVVVGIANLVQAFKTDFGKQLHCHADTRRWACWVGRIGYAARGLAFLPLGFLIVKSGFDQRASEARNLGGALQALESQPVGSTILLLTGVGLMAFGAFAVVEARWRRIDAPDPT